MKLPGKKALKHVLGELPWTAEVYWQLRQGGKPLSKSFSLRRTEKHLPEWQMQAAAARKVNKPLGGKKILIFATLRYWIEHAALLGMAMAGLGHEVTLATLPYANWMKPFNRFDLRRQNAYTHKALAGGVPLLQTVSFLDLKASGEAGKAALPAELMQAVREISLRDTQYSLQVEEVDQNSDLYRLRVDRNTRAAQAALAWMQNHRPDVLATPNGSILEMGAVYAVARYLGIPAVTYEFGEQRGRIWLAYNDEVMRQDTRALWEIHKDQPLTESEWEQVRALFASRQRASLWENFSRLWQETPSQGGEQARQALGLDSRPVALLAANVIGDSLTLGRQVFSQSMTEWLERSVQFFAKRPDVQFVVRIHPGERYTTGPSVADVVQRALPERPEHVRLVEAGDPINTYDLVSIADLGLVYTTTVGMEMAMSGVAVIAAGHTHYRGKGFTLDPDTWEAYFSLLEQALADPAHFRPTREQVECAWQYAYRFFFDYPCPFPWHLLKFWEELETWPVERLLADEGQARFGAAFRYLAGEPMNWDNKETL